ncbi:TolC family protein, partial [Burkholderia gladioli]
MTRRFIRPGFPSMPAAVAAVAAAVAAVACLSLAACTVGPDFKPPQANAPAQWHDLQAASAAAATSASAPGVTSSPVVDADPDPRWWRAFHDPLLDQLVDRAARDNLDVRTAVMRIAEAREQLHQAAAQGLPNVRATASYQ